MPFSGAVFYDHGMPKRPIWAAGLVLWLAAAALSAEEISVAAVGDVMPGSTWPQDVLPPEDGLTLLYELEPLLREADAAFGNLEGPLLEGGTPRDCGPEETPCRRFRIPVRYGGRLKDAGFDVMSLANDHAMDFGEAGRDSTRQALDALNIAHSGARGDAARLTVKDRSVAVLAFSCDGYSHDMNDIEAAVREVAALAETHDIVIVSFHGGREGAKHQRVGHGTEWHLGRGLGDARTFAHAVVDAGADLVLGHGPRVLRGMEVYQDRLIAYSLGNFATYGRFDRRGALGLSVILRARLDEDGRFLGGRIVPLRLAAWGKPRLDKRRAAVRKVRALSKKDFGKTAVTVGRDGTLRPPALD